MSPGWFQESRFPKGVGYPECAGRVSQAGAESCAVCPSLEECRSQAASHRESQNFQRRTSEKLDAQVHSFSFS